MPTTSTTSTTTPEPAAPGRFQRRPALPPPQTTLTPPPPPRSPTTQPAATIADYERLEALTLAAMPTKQRNHCDKKRENVADTRAKLYAANIFNGMSPRRACLAAGIDPRTDWGLITYWRATDPVFRAVCRNCEEVQRQRIKEKALGVLEDTLDGEEVGKQAARVACEICIERGVRRDGGTPGGGSCTPQVIINLPQVPVSRCNSVANNGATVFTAKIVDDNAE